jgi:hypothetical protein
MGNKKLNRFLLDNCSYNAIKKDNLSNMCGKTIAIDTSIYMYKFQGEGALIENMYRLISILRHYDIRPIFVFDGKPPSEKKETLYQRRIVKHDAEAEYNLLVSQLSTTTEAEDKKLIESKMLRLKNQFIYITYSHIMRTKELFDAYGVNYINAEGEADTLCVKLVLSGVAWACMSDDMDMFIYGCPRVLRQLSLLNHTCILYDTEMILKELEMPLQVFRQIMILTGTDYNTENTNNLGETMQWYYAYQSYLLYNNTNVTEVYKSSNLPELYIWMRKQNIVEQDFEKLISVYNMFNVDIGAPVIIEPPLVGDNHKLQQILETEGFIFPSPAPA